MTHIYDDPAEFKGDVIKGFAAAFPQYVQRVAGASGFVRAGGALEGKVSLVEVPAMANSAAPWASQSLSSRTPSTPHARWLMYRSSRYGNACAGSAPCSCS